MVRDEFLNNINIKPLDLIHIPLIVAAFKKLGWNKPSSQFERYLTEQNNHERSIWVAWERDEFVGYVTLKWKSDYPSFAKENIPEINDLNVLPQYRKNGIGSKLLDLAESEAFARCQFVGIGVGLFSDYGTAQKLYVKRGFVPNGEGITSNSKTVKWGDVVQVDDDLILWFIKSKRKLR